MKHSGLAGLKTWDRTEYAAGYRARLSAIPDWDAANATMLYQVGSNPDALNLIKRDFILTAIIKACRPR